MVRNVYICVWVTWSKMLLRWRVSDFYGSASVFGMEKIELKCRKYYVPTCGSIWYFKFWTIRGNAYSFRTFSLAILNHPIINPKNQGFWVLPSISVHSAPLPTFTFMTLLVYCKTVHIFKILLYAYKRRRNQWSIDYA